jgi:outer membrane protein OmpA-like peptidoglycan-associated protein
MSILSNKIRVGTVGVTVAAMTFAVLPASAAPAPAHRQQRASKEENIGVVTGAAVGAAAGGPIGAMVGIVAGALLGHHYHHQLLANHELAARNHELALQNAALAASLGSSERQREGLAGKLHLLTHSLAAVAAQRADLDRAVRLSDDIETDVMFKTGDASINSLQRPALRKIGALAASLPPGERVRIDGYADPRGPAALNEALSVRRAKSVALALERAGCPLQRLVIEGHGAGAPQGEPGRDLDVYAFDRRVTVRLEPAAAVARAAPARSAEVADATPFTPGS